MTELRNDLKVIFSLIDQGSKVLDLGCGNGELLAALKEKECVVRGIEQDFEYMNVALSKKIPVFLGDINKGLDVYEDDFFDYIVLSSTIQQLSAPDEIISKMLRKGKKAIVSFTNYGYYLNRISFLLNGKKPVNEVYHQEWFDTVETHPLTIKDFENYCKIKELNILKRIYLGGDWKTYTNFFPNLLSGYAIYLITK